MVCGGDTPAGGSMIDRNSNNSQQDSERQIATIESHPRPMAIPTVTCDLASDISTSDNAENTQQDVQDQKDTLKVLIFAMKLVDCKTFSYLRSNYIRLMLIEYKMFLQAMLLFIYLRNVNSKVFL